LDAGWQYAPACTAHLSGFVDTAAPGLQARADAMPAVASVNEVAAQATNMNFFIVFPMLH